MANGLFAVDHAVTAGAWKRSANVVFQLLVVNNDALRGCRANGIVTWTRNWRTNLALTGAGNLGAKNATAWARNGRVINLITSARNRGSDIAATWTWNWGAHVASTLASEAWCYVQFSAVSRYIFAHYARKTFYRYLCNDVSIFSGRVAVCIRVWAG